MKIAYTMALGRGDVDLLLYQVSKTLIAEGLTPAGTAQVNTDRADAGPCDMDVIVLPDGPTIRISQSLGREARGCRLDPAALETAVASVEARLGHSDCLIVNKFGKHEADGRGFRPVIADALAMGLPVLVGLNDLNAPAFFKFCDGFAEKIDPEASALTEWVRRNARSKLLQV